MPMPQTPDSPLAGLFAQIVGTAAVVAATTNQAPVLDASALLLPLMSHQVEAVARIHADVDQYGGSYVGDDMGLGKTFEALAAIALRPNAYPALVICPPSVTLNWRNEARRLIPGVRVEVLSGTKASLPAPADIYIVGDAVLAAWAGLRQVTYTKRNGEQGKKDIVDGVLTSMGIRALVIDEAHRFKSYKAQRARAAMAFAATLPTGALRVLMSGTAVVNRPEELSTQLRIAGVDHVFGGWYSFLNRYCPKVDRFGSRGAAHLDELHQRLVSTFYLRRLRTEVLTLPGKGRTLVGTAMAGKAARDYLRAQDDLIAYLTGEKGKAAAAKAGKAEALVLLNTLRNLVGLAKIDAVVAYVTDLVESDEQVFVACWHKEMADALVKAFPGAVQVVGGMTVEAKQAAVEAFQAGEARVMVGNIIAAGVGITLTAARHVVIAELPWTPGDLNQVEDRLDRIGQTREVVSHLMLGTNGVPTVDERLMGILNDKAGVTGTIMDGQAASIIDDDSIASALLDSYREGAY
jgi:SWI/SNF-related matrix-associated actin-dependent regulator 1 of chromatin subfamily A